MSAYLNQLLTLPFVLFTPQTRPHHTCSWLLTPARLAHVAPAFLWCKLAEGFELQAIGVSRIRICVRSDREPSGSKYTHCSYPTISQIGRQTQCLKACGSCADRDFLAKRAAAERQTSASAGSSDAVDVLMHGGLDGSSKRSRPASESIDC